jgi:hypothetical protein
LNFFKTYCPLKCDVVLDVIIRAVRALLLLPGPVPLLHFLHEPTRRHNLLKIVIFSGIQVLKFSHMTLCAKQRVFYS